MYKSISANKSSNNGTKRGGENLSSFKFTLFSWLGNEFNSHNIFSDYFITDKNSDFGKSFCDRFVK